MGRLSLVAAVTKRASIVDAVANILDAVSMAANVITAILFKVSHRRVLGKIKPVEKHAVTEHQRIPLLVGMPFKDDRPRSVALFKVEQAWHRPDYFVKVSGVSGDVAV